MDRHAGKRKEAAKAKKAFNENPFRFVKRLLNEKTSGILTDEQVQLENHLKNTYSNANRGGKVKQLLELNRPTPPSLGFNTSMVKFQEVVRKASVDSAAGPNRVTYALYMNYPMLLRCL